MILGTSRCSWGRTGDPGDGLVFLKQSVPVRHDPPQQFLEAIKLLEAVSMTLRAMVVSSLTTQQNVD